MNPFSNGSASYLANLVVNLMPDAGGDNAMWKERAVALLFALLPALTYKRDKQGLLLDVGVVRDYLELKQIIQLSRDQTLSERVTRGLISYLNTLPGYVDAAFDDEGNERPPSPDQPMYDLQVARQQHGYLAMQFTRSMQSLADEYGYIFKVQLADIDVLDVVLNRRILIVLIPALEKSDNEAANLGKIVASCLKGMMGATLGNTVEGGWEDAIGSKQTRASSSFMTVFDEVGYYTAAGMAVMAAQARSLGFSLVFATQDLPSMEKRIKQEAKSIVGNCNLKIFGRIEDPTDTRDFVSKHSGTRWVMESSGFSASTNTISSMFMTLPFQDNRNTSYQSRARVDYDHLRGQREGEAHLMFADWAHRSQMFYAVAEKAKALRVHRFLPVPILTKSTEMRDRAILELTARLKDADWTAMNEGGSVKTSPEIAALSDAVQTAAKAGLSALEMGVFAVASISKLGETAAKEASSGDTAPKESSKDKKAPAITNTRGGQPLTTPVSALAEDTELAQTPREKFSDMPAVTENDVFSIEELERAPVYTAPQTIASFAGTNADLSAVVPSTRLTQDSTDFAALTLPDSVKSALAESAQRMSKGLSGKAGQV